MEVRADDFARLAKALKESGRKDLQRELFKGINRAVRPLRADIKESAEDILPRRGGLAGDVAGSKFATRRNKRGIRLITRGRWNLYNLDQGIVRHPRKDGGATIQRIQPGFHSKPAQAALPEVRRELQESLRDVVRKIDRAV
jgi:hypothetical protein